MTVTRARSRDWVIRCDQSEHCGSSLHLHADNREIAEHRAVTEYGWTRVGDRILCRTHEDGADRG